MLRFTCDVGFSLLGSSDRQCQENGTWSGTNAFCQGEKSINQNSYLTKAWHTCFGQRKGKTVLLFFLLSKAFFCTQFSSKQLVSWCYSLPISASHFISYLANDCGTLSVPLNGTRSGNLTTYPNKVIFQCDEGFSLRGSAERRCQPNKQWSGNDTFCEGTYSLFFKQKNSSRLCRCQFVSQCIVSKPYAFYIGVED